MTKLVYLDDTYACHGKGVVVSVSRDERGGYFVLDQTVFYPQGGGQPADKGYALIEGDQVPVVFVGYQNAEVRHYVPEAFFKETYIGQTAQLSVDKTFRLANARLHTGGHLISHVLETIDSYLIPIKGYHFPDGAYVEFMNERGVDLTPLVQKANDQLAKDVGDSVEIEAQLSDFPTISKLRPYLAPFIPKDKPSRVVTIGQYVSLPCGGTHVKTLGELGRIAITKFKKQKSNVRVSYQIG